MDYEAYTANYIPIFQIFTCHVRFEILFRIFMNLEKLIENGERLSILGNSTAMP